MTSRARPLSAAATVIVTVLLLGLVASPVRAAESRGARHSATVSMAASPPKKGDKYVALGTSIASGFGISVQSPSCGRSNRDYAQLIAAHYKLELVDVSCGAALISNVVDTPQGDNPPQISAVTPDTKLITVAAGGNDIGYNGTAVGCGDPATVCSAPTDLNANLARARSPGHGENDHRRAQPSGTRSLTCLPAGAVGRARLTEQVTLRPIMCGGASLARSRVARLLR